jgi:hypothetical protein
MRALAALVEYVRMHSGDVHRQPLPLGLSYRRSSGKRLQ